MRFIYGPNAKHSTRAAEDILERILEGCGLSDVLITRTVSSPVEQAWIMYDNIDKFGVESQKKLYADRGDTVISVYEHQKAMGAAADVVKREMVRKIIELGPETVSKHCSNDPKKSILDIAPSSVPDVKKDEFKIALGLNPSVERFFYPPDDPAFHIELKVG